MLSLDVFIVTKEILNEFRRARKNYLKLSAEQNAQLGNTLHSILINQDHSFGIC